MNDSSRKVIGQGRFRPLNSNHEHNGGDGGGGDMESRVAKLESDVSDIKTSVALLINKIDSVNDSLSDIKTSVGKLPTSEVVQCRFELVENKLTDLSDKVSKRPNEDKINTKFIEVNSKIELAAEKTETKIKDVRLQIILWILGLPSVVFGVYKLYQALTIAQ